MMKKELDILIPFKGKNKSGDVNDNFLVRYKNIYFMDNHRLALWCWCQEINTTQIYNFLHVDMHHDFYDNGIDISSEEYNNVQGIKEYSLQKYEDAKILDSRGRTCNVFTYKDYSIYFFRMFIQNLEEICFLTCENPEIVEEEIKNINQDKKSKFIDTNQFGNIFFNIDSILKKSSNWIVNIDLDFFFCENLARDIILQYSEEFIDEFFSVILRYIDTNIAVLTIALSPECCGGNNNNLSEGWNNSLKLTKMLFKKLEIPFNEIFERNPDYYET